MRHSRRLWRDLSRPRVQASLHQSRSGPRASLPMLRCPQLAIWPAPRAPHSPAFEDFMRKFEKAETYCPGSKPPCEESLRREKVFHANLAAIEAHNAAREGEGSEGREG